MLGASAARSWPLAAAMLLTTLLLGSAALHAAIAINQNAARHAASRASETGDIHLAAFAPIERNVAEPAPMVEEMLPEPVAFDQRQLPWIGPPPEEIATAMLPQPEPFDARPVPWLGPAPEVLIAAMIPPLSLQRPEPWLGPPIEEQIVAMIVPPPSFDQRETPAMPEPALPLLEPHMDAREDWVIRTWLHRNPGIQRVRFQPNVQARCLPSSLLKVLYDAAMRFGEVRVISGYRSPSHNRRVGGASRSLHMECRAIDFYIPGPATGVLGFLTGRKEVGGYKRYPFGSYHIDNGPRRTWGGPSRRRTRGPLVASAGR